MIFFVSRERKSISPLFIICFFLFCSSITFAQQATVTTVSAASYEPSAAVAPGSIVSSFGNNLTTVTMAATDTNPATPQIELPTSLGGTTVQVNNIFCGLLYVSPAQINFVMPEGLSNGNYSVIISDGNNSSYGGVSVSRLQPSIFSMNSDGQGVLAANIVRVKADGSQQRESLAQLDPTTNRMIPKPIDLGPLDERVFIEIYLTGSRLENNPNDYSYIHRSVFVLLGGKVITPVYAGKQGFFAGIDQVNIELPRSLIGKGKIYLSIHGNVDDSINLLAGFTSNIVELEIAPASGTTPPIINNISASIAQVSDIVVINGSGFASNLSDNTVTFGGIKGDVEFVSSTQLKARIPFGAKSGKVKVSNTQGEAISPTEIKLRTSVSGLIETLLRTQVIPLPLQNITVRVAGTKISTTTNQAGIFVLPDVPEGDATLEIDPSTFAISTKFPFSTLKTSVVSGRDNAQPAIIWGIFGTATSSSIYGSGTVIGTLTESDGVTPVPNAIIRIHDYFFEEQRIRTDGNGSYIFRNVNANEIIGEVIRANGTVFEVFAPRTKARGVEVINLSLKNSPLNRSPIIFTPSDSIMNPQTVDIPIYISDPDAGDTVQTSVSGAPYVSLITGANGLYKLHLTPTKDQLGIFPIEIKAVDSHGNQTTSTLAVTVRLPEISVTPTVSAKIGETLDIPFSLINFFPNSPLQVSASGMQNISIVAGTDGNYNLRLNSTAIGIFPVTIKVLDSRNIETEVTITVRVNPKISLPATASLTLGKTLDVPFSISGFTVSPQFTASGMQNIFVITETNGNYILRLDPTTLGGFQVTIKVIDSQGNQATSIISVNVLPVVSVTQGTFNGTIKAIPVGAPVRAIDYDPNQGFYIGVYNQGIFKSLDNGETFPIKVEANGAAYPIKVGAYETNFPLLAFVDGKLFTATEYSHNLCLACSPKNWGGVYQLTPDEKSFIGYWGKYFPAGIKFYFTNLIPFPNDLIVQYRYGSNTENSYIRLSPNIEIEFGYRPIASSVEKDGDVYLGLLAPTQAAYYIRQTSPLAKISSAKKLTYLNYPLNENGAYPEIYGLASDGNAIYALDGGLSLSYDNGLTWNRLAIPELSDGSAKSIIKFKDRMVVTYAKGLLIQSANKMDWQIIPVNFEGRVVTKLLVKDADIFCLTSDGTLYKISGL